MPGFVFVACALYLTLLVAFTITLLDHPVPRRIGSETLRRWGKLLGGLVVLGIVVQLITIFG